MWQCLPTTAKNLATGKRSRGGLPTLEQARALTSVARTQSLRATRAELGLAHAGSVYHLLERLAASLGLGPLVTNTVKGRVTLTPDGEQVIAQAQALADAYEALRGSGQTIRFACYPITAGRAAPTVLAFAEKHRLERLEVVFYGISDELRRDRGAGLLTRAVSGEIDVVIAPATKVPGLVDLDLYAWKLRIVVHEDDPLRHEETVAIDHLAGRRMLLAPHGHLSRYLYESAAVGVSTPPDVAMELVDQHVLKAIATAGRAYTAVVPDDAFGAPDESLGPRLVDANGADLGGQYALFYSERHDNDSKRGLKRSVAVLKFVEALHEALNDQLPSVRLTKR